MSDPSPSTPPPLIRHIADIRLRARDSRIAWQEAMASVGGRNTSGTILLNLLGALGLGLGAWWHYGRANEAILVAWLTFMSGFFACAAMTGTRTALVRGRMVRHLREREELIAQPLAMHEGDDGVIFVINGTPVVYRWTQIKSMKRLNRGRLWWALTDSYDAIYASEEDFGSREAFEAFANWAEQAWKDRQKVGSAFPVLGVNASAER